MTPPRVLILFGTSYGQTAKIADRLREHLVGHGCTVTLVDARTAAPDLTLEGFDCAIIGASIVVGHHQKEVRAFVREHLATLNAMPSAFFSVSGSAGGRLARQRAAAQDLLDQFLTETGWHPSLNAIFGGAIKYTRYNFFLRWVMRRISAAEGGSTDTSRDHELTDWTAVEAFAAQCAGLVAVSPMS